MDTVTVEIKVAVDRWGGILIDPIHDNIEGLAYYNVTAELPIPDSLPEIKAKSVERLPDPAP